MESVPTTRIKFTISTTGISHQVSYGDNSDSEDEYRDNVDDFDIEVVEFVDPFGPREANKENQNVTLMERATDEVSTSFKPLSWLLVFTLSYGQGIVAIKLEGTSNSLAGYKATMKDPKSSKKTKGKKPAKTNADLPIPTDRFYVWPEHFMPGMIEIAGRQSSGGFIVSGVPWVGNMKQLWEKLFVPLGVPMPKIDPSSAVYSVVCLSFTLH